VPERRSEILMTAHISASPARSGRQCFSRRSCRSVRWRLELAAVSARRPRVRPRPCAERHPSRRFGGRVAPSRAVGAAAPQRAIGHVNRPLVVRVVVAPSRNRRSAHQPCRYGEHPLAHAGGLPTPGLSGRVVDNAAPSCGHSGASGVTALARHFDDVCPAPGTRCRRSTP
jgi:hypothetical protein